MPSAAISGVGTTLERSNGASTPLWSTIAEIVQITGPGMVREVIDVTNLDSADGYREYIGGFRDGGTVVLNMNYTRDGYEDFRVDFTADSTVDFRITLSDTSATQISFTGFVTDLPLTIPTDDKVSIDVTIKVTGAVTLTS